MKPILPAGEKTTIGQSQDNMRLTRVIERWTRLHSFPIRKVHIKPRLEYGFAKCFIDLGCMLSPFNDINHFFFPFPIFFDVVDRGLG